MAEFLVKLCLLQYINSISTKRFCDFVISDFKCTDFRLQGRAKFKVYSHLFRYMIKNARSRVLTRSQMGLSLDEKGPQKGDNGRCKPILQMEQKLFKWKLQEHQWLQKKSQGEEILSILYQQIFMQVKIPQLCPSRYSQRW